MARMIAEEVVKLLGNDITGKKGVQSGNKPPVPSENMTAAQAAAYAGCSISTIYHNAKMIPSEEVAGRRKYSKEGIMEWSRQRKALKQERG